VLARLRDTKGVEHTDALVLAIPKLEGSARHAARQALAQRLTRMTAATLRTMLQDDDAEVRRAAAVACGRKKAAEHVPDLLPLLDDPEVEVVQTARAALRALSGEDFGPDEDAEPAVKARAVTAWREWWRKQPAPEK
jgi:HEAT repeat protein